jgi:DNA-binding HxlR family transcriptional regulator
MLSTPHLALKFDNRTSQRRVKRDTCAMKSYGQFCPIAVAAEIFAERWTPLVLRELFAGSRHFNEIERGVPRMSKSVLSQRLRALIAAGVIERHETGGRGTEYQLTPAGKELAEIAILMGDWAVRWADIDIGAHNVDPDLLMWDMHRRIHLDRLPDCRVVVRFELTGARLASYWLLLERPEPSLCLFDPGFDVDLYVTADTVALHRVWMGQMDLAKALRDGQIALDGPAPLRRAFPSWLALGFYALRQQGARRRQRPLGRRPPGRHARLLPGADPALAGGA